MEFGRSIFGSRTVQNSIRIYQRRIPARPYRNQHTRMLAFNTSILLSKFETKMGNILEKSVIRRSDILDGGITYNECDAYSYFLKI